MTREVRCDVNPELGWEILPPLPRVTGQVRVIGGGVMGLEAARVQPVRALRLNFMRRRIDSVVN
jgi:hypothetical protein